MLVRTGDEAICEPLVDFFTVVLANPSATNEVPLTLHPRIGIAGYVPSSAVVSYL
jgi:hypothetical protein